VRLVNFYSISYFLWVINLF